MFCHMGILSNGHVSVSNLGGLGPLTLKLKFDSDDLRKFSLLGLWLLLLGGGGILDVIFVY